MANGEQQNQMAPIFQAVMPQKKTPMGEALAMQLQERAQQSPLFEAQREGITETQQALAKIAEAPKQNQNMGVLAALTDIVSGTGTKYSQLYNSMKPKDQTKATLELKKLLRSQQQGLTDDQLKFMQNQMIAGGNAANPLDNKLKSMRVKAEEAKIKKIEDQAKVQSESLKNVGQILVRDINLVNDIIDKKGAWGTTYGGLTGMSLVPGSDANVLRKHLDSVKGNIAVDQLLNIKRQGSGLGQVPQSQLDMLSTLMGSLKPDLPPQELKKNLKDIEAIYSKIVETEGGDPLALYNKRMGKGGAAKPKAAKKTYKSEAAKRLAEEHGL